VPIFEVGLVQKIEIARAGQPGASQGQLHFQHGFAGFVHAVKQGNNALVECLGQHRSGGQVVQRAVGKELRKSWVYVLKQVLGPAQQANGRGRLG